jgi:hypothetical protein
MSTPYPVSGRRTLTIQIPKPNATTTHRKKTTPEKGAITKVFENSTKIKNPTANLPIPLKHKTKNWEEEYSPALGISASFFDEDALSLGTVIFHGTPSALTDSPSPIKSSKEKTDQVGRQQLNSPSEKENQRPEKDTQKPKKTDKVGRQQLNSPSKMENQEPGKENQEPEETDNDSPHWDAELQFPFDPSEEESESTQPTPEKYIS